MASQKVMERDPNPLAQLVADIQAGLVTRATIAYQTSDGHTCYALAGVDDIVHAVGLAFSLVVHIQRLEGSSSKRPTEAPESVQ